VLSPRNGAFLLHARDIMQEDLTADLVAMAACRSAGTKAYAGEGLVGLAWAFLHAGARNVVATLWDVNDRSTAQLMSAFYSRLGRGMPPAAALHEAKLELIRSRPGLQKPWYWAAFQHYVGRGAGGRRPR
jgi:CHAT domain-containing protein